MIRLAINLSPVKCVSVSRYHGYDIVSVESTTFTTVGYAVRPVWNIVVIRSGQWIQSLARCELIVIGLTKLDPSLSSTVSIIILLFREVRGCPR
jgi:hypothetical protein